ILNDRSGLEVRSQFQGWRAPGSKPDFPEDSPCMECHAVAKCPRAALVFEHGEGTSSGAVLDI
ncbi:hypothetical protein AVEN_181527-1, partial [Araneus ventricosus]